MKRSRVLRGGTSRRGYPVELRFGKLLKRHLAYWIGLLVTGILHEVPLPVCSWAMSRIFLIWYAFFVKYRRRSEKHLRQVFGETRCAKWYAATVRTMFMNLGRNLAEFLHIPRSEERRVGKECSC